MTVTALNPALPAPHPARSPRYQVRRVPLRHVLTSLFGLGPIPLRWLVRVLALVREQHRIGAARPPDELSNLEAMVRIDGHDRAVRVRDRGLRRLGRLAERIGHLQARIDYLAASVGNQLDDPVTGAHREALTLRDAIEREQALRIRIEVEVERGSLKHRRVTKGVRRMAWVAPPIDLPVLGYFLGELFNVNWLNPADRPAQFAAAVVFAVLGTVGVALGLRALGRTMRAHKNDRGQLELPPGTDRVLPLAELVATVTTVGGAGVIMAVRIIDEAAGAAISPAAAIVLGAFFAVVTVVVNWTVYSAEFRDGSVETEQIDAVAGAIRAARSRTNATVDRMCRLEDRIARRRSARQRVAAATLTATDRPARAADQLVLLARAYHLGTGYQALLPPSSPTVDLTDLQSVTA